MDQPEILLKTQKFSVVRRRRATPTGAQETRETIEHPGAVVMLPLLDDGRVCLIRNYRFGVDETLIELPAGTLEPGEDPSECAARELAEETGYTAGKLQQMHAFWMSPGILKERMHLFLATTLSLGLARPEADEQIEPLLVEWEAAVEMARTGGIHDAKTLVGLLYYERFRRPNAEANR